MGGLYPYSRFAYESVTNYIMGDNMLITNTNIFVVVKLMTMAICFAFSIFIAALLIPPAYTSCVVSTLLY